MAGERLQVYGLDLSDYILGQIRLPLSNLPERPMGPLPKLDCDGFHRLTLAEWLGREVASPPAPLAEHVWKGVGGGPA
jgi:hypothetical protein